MGSGDLSTGLTVGILTPASAVRTLEDHSEHAANQDAQPKARRRPRHGESDSDEISSSPEADEAPAHQFDDIA